MAKLIVSDSVKNRIKFAALNGSAVAQKIETILKDGRNKSKEELIGDKKHNYFDTVKIKDRDHNWFRIEFSCCMKDVTNSNFPDQGNPDAVWFKENRTKLTPANFAKLFTDIADDEFTSFDYQYFQSALCLQSRVHLKISSSMHDIEEAYFEGNYDPACENNDDSHTLHNSCMRYEDKARNAADFYSHVAGARIIYAKDDQDHVLARALVWDNVDFADDYYGVKFTSSFIERTYISYWFLLPLVRQFAIDNGIQLRKTLNTYSSYKQFTWLVGAEYGGHQYNADDEVNLMATKDIPTRCWHKFGCPYTDTMQYVCYDAGRSQLMMSNYDNHSVVAGLQNTGGYAHPSGLKICPVCGKVHSNSGILCGECMNGMQERSVFGTVFTGTVKKWKGISLPSVVFNGNTPNQHTQNWINLQRIFYGNAEDVKRALR